MFGPSDDEKKDYQGHVMSNALTSSLIDESDLPPHHRCAAHTLNLVATTDAEHAVLDSAYKRLSRSRCVHKFGYTTMANEVVSKEDGLQLVRPCASLWNLVFDSVSRLNLICRERGIQQSVTSVIVWNCHSKGTSM